MEKKIILIYYLWNRIIGIKYLSVLIGCCDILFYSCKGLTIKNLKLNSVIKFTNRRESVISVNPAQLLRMNLQLSLFNSTAKIFNSLFTLYCLMPVKIWIRLRITGKKTFLVSCKIQGSYLKKLACIKIILRRLIRLLFHSWNYLILLRYIIIIKPINKQES